MSDRAHLPAGAHFGSAAALALTLFLAAPANGGWVHLGGSLNYDVGDEADAPAVTTVNDVPYVAWCEATGNSLVYVKAFTAGSWNLVGGGSLNMSTSREASEPDIVASDGEPYVAWCERQATGLRQIFVKRYNGASWIQVGSGPLNRASYRDAKQVSLDVADNDRVYVAWCEGTTSPSRYEVFVSHWDGGNWIADGGGLTLTASASSPDIVLWGSTPYVTWSESSNIYVKLYDGSTWYPLGGALDYTLANNAVYPVIAHTASTVHVAWHEIIIADANILTKRWNGAAWTEPVRLNHNTGENGQVPDIIVNLNTPYITWMEYNGSNYDNWVKYYAGTGTWRDVGSGPLDRDPAHNVWSPRLGIGSNVLLAAWREDDAGGIGQIYVNAWDLTPPTPVPTAAPTSTPTPSAAQAVPPDEVFVYPQPASTQATFVFHATTENGEVEVVIYNTHYRRIERLTGQTPNGRGQIVWDTSGVPPGVYFYRVTVGGQKFAVRKLVVAR